MGKVPRNLASMRFMNNTALKIALQAYTATGQRFAVSLRVRCMSWTAQDPFAMGGYRMDRSQTVRPIVVVRQQVNNTRIVALRSDDGCRLPAV